MHDYWTIATTNIMCMRSQNYTKYGGWQTWNTNIWSCDVVAYVICFFNVFVPTSAHPKFIFGQAVCSNILKGQFLACVCKCYTIGHRLICNLYNFLFC